MSDIDAVTLLQIEKGVRIYSARYLGGNGKSSAPYNFKADTVFRPGEIALAGRNAEDASGSAYSLVSVIEEITEAFEPTPGLTYVWISPVHTGALDALMENDRQARKTIRLGAAIRAAKEGLGEMAEKVQLLPPKVGG